LLNLLFDTLDFHTSVSWLKLQILWTLSSLKCSQV
jgi:hypothetical protein